ncbi:MAG: toxin TcdB middle/N-terminal domain-containing protein, partial [Myxococcota bacterium]
INGLDGVGSALEGDFDFEDGGLQSLRFIDYNNDKKIDLMRATPTDTTFMENEGASGFSTISGVDRLGVSFDADGVQLSDMNGDGLIDVVVVSAGQLRYKLNYGWGRWSPFVTIDGLPITNAEIAQTELEDINGDGLSDLVVVSGSVIKYALNTNGAEFSLARTITTNDVEGDLPERVSGMTVLFADMNANGSSDVVYVDASGRVQYLELFPVRPNLLNRIENGLGQVTAITYGSSVQQQALDRAEGLPDWETRLPHPMLVVTKIDKYERLTGDDQGGGIHEETHYRYHNGFYDGVEKQFRGYMQVEAILVGDASQEGGVTEMVYDVGMPREEGLEGDAGSYYNGLLLSRRTSSAGRVLSHVTHTYDVCEVDGVPNTTELPIKHICKTRTETLLQEGTSADRHTLTRESYRYDGYGNVTLNRNEGVVSTGGGGCAPCEGRDADTFGAPCSAQCLGDEIITETAFIEPGPNTRGRWITGSPYRERIYGRSGSAQVKETLTYYDGSDFVGLDLGQMDQGNITRVTEAVQAGSPDVIEVVRNAYDDHGNVVETMDPNGRMGTHDHRRRYTYDDDQLRVTLAEVLLLDSDDQPYTLRREMSYEPMFDKVAEATDWLLADPQGQVLSGRRSFFYLYDEFGRMINRVRPGDNPSFPTDQYTYDLGSPVSRIISTTRSQASGELDLETITCLDGRGRAYQTRTRLGEGLYQVHGFTAYNVRSNPVRIYQPTTSNSAQCDTEIPSDVAFTAYTYDATYRLLTTTRPDASIYGDASQLRRVYEPLSIRAYDAEDNDPSSPYADTPTITHTDGLGRTVSIKRLLGPQASETLELRYDSLGRLMEVQDPAGHIKTQEHDLLGRVTRVVDPNSAHDVTYQYDDASNVIRMVDDRQIVTLSEYDGMNRLIRTWDEADPEGTSIRWTYDRSSNCDRNTCANAEGKLVLVTYPGPGGQQAVDRVGYDLRGRMAYTSRTLAGFPFEFTMNYDSADRLVATTYPDSEVIENTWDDAGRLTGIAGLVHTISYDERGQLNNMGCADGSSTTMMYDAIMRPSDKVITAADTILQGFGYTRDRNGNLTSIVDQRDVAGPSFDVNYSYDAWYRVLEARLSPGGAESEVVSMQYNAIDNLTRMGSTKGASLVDLGDLSYGDSRPNAVTQAGGITYSYDASGNMNGRHNQTMTWDFMGRMTSVSEGDTQVAQFIYGSNQSRVAKTEGDSTVLYAGPNFDIRDGIVALYVKVGGERVVRLENDRLATDILGDAVVDGQVNAADAWMMRSSDSAGPLLWSSVRRLFLDETGSSTTFLHSDHLRSITLATQANGDQTQVVGQRNFYPLGMVREEVGYVDEYGFTGQEIDHSTGLVHFDWRYYDPRMGRWLSI